MMYEVKKNAPKGANAIGFGQEKFIGRGKYGLHIYYYHVSVEIKVDGVPIESK